MKNCQKDKDFTNKFEADQQQAVKWFKLCLNYSNRVKSRTLKSFVKILRTFQ